MEVPYLLEELENVIRRIMAHDPLPPDERSRLTEKFLEETETVKRTLSRWLFESDNEKHLERCIQYHQQALIKLIDLLPPSRNAPAQTGHHIRPVVAALQSLLNFIEQHFKSYFDLDMNIPSAYSLLLKEEGRHQLEIIEHRLRHVDEELRQLCLRPVRRMVQDDSESAITFRGVIYSKALIRELLRTRTDTSDILNTEDVWKTCLYLNYNSVHAFNYYTRKVSVQISSMDTLPQQIEHLLRQAKENNQAQVRPGISFNMAAPSLRAQLVEWLNEELYFLERKQQLLQQTEKRPPVPVEQKIKIDLSVAQLACLLRLLVETETIVNKNVSELIRRLVRAVQTKRSESISDESLRLKYYNIEDGTKDAVLALLQKLTKYVAQHLRQG